MARRVRQEGAHFLALALRRRGRGDEHETRDFLGRPRALPRQLLERGDRLADRGERLLEPPCL